MSSNGGNHYEDGLLRLKALMLGGLKRGEFVHRSYVVEKIDTVLRGGTIGLDSDNVAIYEELKRRRR